jgi:hypothetical protein
MEVGAGFCKEVPHMQLSARLGIFTFHKRVDFKVLWTNPELHGSRLIDSDNFTSYISKSFQGLSMGESKKVTFS